MSVPSRLRGPCESYYHLLNLCALAVIGMTRTLGSVGFITRAYIMPS